ncbi:hypothetical protein OCH239_06635 [Roseivivax halodurans JCM 10272]|uniref:FlgN-like protein n=1 Tax=Roseivivax halodurans JCM 10272 TaxID=1449350 RepID=X7EF85_9RHOB|nr:flagellar protein FlgN [Roseivivax halodurans]ETX13866.1 hypothetical protein OCH239_06635 [Roseivivax halodurans JCM 10272]
MSDCARTAIADLDQLLEEERAALLGGDLAALDKLLERKSVLIETLAREATSIPQELEPLQIKLRRNRELFEQALAGLRAVSDRLQALREVHEGGETYDVSGRRRSIEKGAQHRLEKRA